MMLFQRDGGRFRHCEDELGPKWSRDCLVCVALKMEVAGMLFVGGRGIIYFRDGEM